MKRSLICIAVLVLSLLVPEYRTDVGKLIPVNLIYIYEEEGVVLETDTGNEGRGDTLEEAIRDLKETASGEIFLDTADYLLTESEDLALIMTEYLNGSVRVCITEESLDLEQAAEYLQVHRPKGKLKTAKEEGIREQLTETEGQMKIVEIR